MIMRNYDEIFDKCRPLLDYPVPLDHCMMMRYLRFFADRYSFLDFGCLGMSVMGREIPVVRLGDKSADRQVLYVGTHHGMEWITSVLLLRFINEYCDALCGDRRMYNVNLGYVFRTRCIHIVPMLNPDGTELQIHGADCSPLRDRLIKMNGGSDDFSRWQANARGVDLNHNYDDGFFEYKRIEAENGIVAGPTKYSGEAPESEPETAALANYIRFYEKIGTVLTLHTQGEVIYSSSRGNELPRSRHIARLFSEMSGYEIGTPEGTASYGGLTDWMINEEKRLSFTLECGKGTNPLPLGDYYKIYSPVREILFTAPVV